MPNIAIIFAGGTGQRMNYGTRPKQFLEINGTPIIVHTLKLFEKHPLIDKIYIAIHPDYMEYMKELVENHNIKKTAGICKGGNTGQDSIYRALSLARLENPGNSIVLIHDGVRPNITSAVISNNIKCAQQNGNAITSTACFETILISEDGKNPKYVPPRKNTFAAQAPQTFFLDEIIEAHNITREKNPQYIDIVDSCTLYKTIGKETYMIEGNRGNIKITTAEDLYVLRALLQYREDSAAFGISYKSEQER